MFYHSTHLSFNSLHECTYTAKCKAKVESYLQSWNYETFYLFELQNMKHSDYLNFETFYLFELQTMKHSIYVVTSEWL